MIRTFPRLHPDAAGMGQLCAFHYLDPGFKTSIGPWMCKGLSPIHSVWHTRHFAEQSATLHTSLFLPTIHSKPQPHSAVFCFLNIRPSFRILAFANAIPFSGMFFLLTPLMPGFSVRPSLTSPMKNPLLHVPTSPCSSLCHYPDSLKFVCLHFYLPQEKGGAKEQSPILLTTSRTPATDKALAVGLLNE